MKRFVVFKRGDRWFWRLMDAQKICAESPATGYLRRIDCNNAVEAVRSLPPDVPIDLLPNGEDP